MNAKLISGPDALVFFYAVFWALTFGPATRFRAFDTQLLFEPGRCKRAFWRMLVTILIINAAPLAWFMILYEHVVPHTDEYSSVFAAGIASLVLPGFQRFLHAFLLTDCFRCFYTMRERLEILKEWRPRREDRVNYFNAFFIPGVGYICLATGFAEIALNKSIIGICMIVSLSVPLAVWWLWPRQSVIGFLAGIAAILFVVVLVFR